MTPEQQQVVELRQRLWRNGFRPVPCLTNDKVPLGRDWPERARQNPPECLRFDPVPHALNTGVLADALRLIDIDIDDPGLAEMAADLVAQTLGDAPTRFRCNSPRRCFAYRAAVGEPAKRSIVGPHGKVEILGRGQQCLAFGRHPSGVELEWTLSPADQITLADLPIASEDQITVLLEALAPLIGAPPPRANGIDEHAAGEPQADIQRIVDAMARIPNNGPSDWEWWNRIGMALFAATGGTNEGRLIWHQWSALNPCYDSKTTQERWKHYHRSPPDRLGAGSLIYAAQKALQAHLDSFLDLGLTPAVEARPVDDADPWTRAAQPQKPSLPELPPEPDWPEPIGREAYRGLLGETVDATVPTTEADRNAVLIQHLVFFGNAIGIDAETPYCVIGNRGIHRTNLFALIVGESAYSRKGTSTNDVGAIYASVDGQWFKDHIKSGLSSGEGLIHVVRDPVMGLDDDGNPITTEPGSSTKNVLVIEPEFGGPLAVMQRQGNTLATVVRNAWDGTKLETLTRHQPMQATDHLVSVIGQITVAELRQKLLLDDAQNGFANRFLLALARRERLLPRPVPLSRPVIEGFARQLQEAIRAARTRGQMELSEDGWLVWESIYAKVGEPKHGLYGAVVSRGDVQMRRLALLYALLDGKATIEPAHLSAAYAVWRYCVASAFYLFGDKQIDPFADRVLDELRHAPNGLTRTELHAAFGRHITKGALAGALAGLLRDGLALREIRTTAGRPAEVWTYNAGRRP
jgi:hypothetical protein